MSLATLVVASCLGLGLLLPLGFAVVLARGYGPASMYEDRWSWLMQYALMVLVLESTAFAGAVTFFLSAFSAAVLLGEEWIGLGLALGAVPSLMAMWGACAIWSRQAVQPVMVRRTKVPPTPDSVWSHSGGIATPLAANHAAGATE
jgi:hypothetical protein